MRETTNTRRAWRSALLVFPSAMVILVSFQFLTLPGRFGFGPTDDTFHTFVNLSEVRRILRAGELPLISFGNNFGTPLAGDLVSYPWSLQAWTYAWLPGPWAMTLNRMLLAAVSMLTLMVWFRRHMGPWIAGTIATLVFLTPGFLHHFAHHHYQATQLWMSLLLLAQERYLAHRRRTDLWGLAAAMGMAAVSVSHNLTLLMVPVLLVHQLLRAPPGQRWGDTLRVGLALTAGFALSGYETLSFLGAVSASGRVGQSYLDGLSRIPFSFAELLESALWRRFLVRGFNEHVYRALCLTLPVVVLTVFGCFHRWRQRPQGLRWSELVLGLLPVPLVFVLIGIPELYRGLPLVRSTDLTRIWWLTHLFLGLSWGRALEAIAARDVTPRQAFLLLLGSGGLYAVGFGPEFLLVRWQLQLMALSFVGCCALLWWRTLRNAGKDEAPSSEKRSPSRLAWAHHAVDLYPLLVGAFTLTSVAGTGLVAAEILGLLEGKTDSTHFFSSAARAVFQPQSMLAVLPKNVRVATALSSELGHDLNLIPYGIFGTAGRSVLVDGRLARTLLEQQVIVIDQRPLAYSVRPDASADALAALGISYLIVPDTLVSHSTFPVVAHDLEYRLSLLKVPRPTGVVWLETASGRLPIAPEATRVEGNRFQVTLPEHAAGDRLVLTFVARSGYEVWVDGRARPLTVRPDRFLEVVLEGAERQLTLRYRPFGWEAVLAGVLAALLLALLSTWRLSPPNETGCARPAGAGSP